VLQLCLQSKSCEGSHNTATIQAGCIQMSFVKRHIELGSKPTDAALHAMKENSGPVIGIALVLSVSFMPIAFIPCITGKRSGIARLSRAAHIDMLSRV
jgi:hypothetical protein